MVLPEYYNRVNPDLLRRIPADAKVVLEVGCGAGELAAAYRRINPDVRYVGIEKHAEAARAARGRGRLDCVVADDAAVVEPAALELPDPDSDHGPVVDCLVLGDVLEHMLDPWSVLARLSRWVRAGGLVLACVPNVQHYSVLLNLLRGKWEYQLEGLLDRDHLRFFTLSSIQSMFEQAGLHVFDVAPRVWPNADFDRFQEMLGPVVGRLGIDPASFALQTQAGQYVVRAVRAASAPRRMLIWSLLGSVVASEVRIREPGAFLGTIPGTRIVTGTGLQFDDLDRTWPGEARIFIQQRVIIPRPDHLRLQRELLRRGYLIVGEFDDDPAHFAELDRTGFLALRGCHCIQTTTEVMAESLRPYNPHVMVFPNQVAELPAQRADQDKSDTSSQRHDTHDASGPVTIFFGALNREADWAPILPVLNGVLAECGAAARVQVVYDQSFFDALATPHKAFESLCTYERYQTLLHTADIALLPLEPTRFNRHKSDLKYIECAAHSVAVLASPTVYACTIRHGETGLIYGSLGEFATLLDRLIRDGLLRSRISRAAFRYVAENRLLSRHFRARHDWYRAMLERREQLDAELRRRVPELSKS
jgi:SAM-dependent methyltransferase